MIYQELDHDVHFYIGKYSSQDEYGTAAYKTVELDTYVRMNKCLLFFLMLISNYHCRDMKEMYLPGLRGIQE